VLGLVAALLSPRVYRGINVNVTPEHEGVFLVVYTAITVFVLVMGGVFLLLWLPLLEYGTISTVFFFLLFLCSSAAYSLYGGLIRTSCKSPPPVLIKYSAPTGVLRTSFVGIVLIFLCIAQFFSGLVVVSSSIAPGGVAASFHKI